MSIWQAQIHHHLESCQQVMQEKFNEIFRDLQNAFGVADDILIVEPDADGQRS